MDTEQETVEAFTARAETWLADNMPRQATGLAARR